MQKKVPTVMTLSADSTPIHTSSYETNWDYQEPFEALQTSSRILVPLSIFSHKEPTMQLLIRYLREHELLDFATIATVLGRAESTVRVTHRNANKEVDLHIDTTLCIPADMFAQTGLSPLETLVYFLKQQGLKNIQIAKALHLDPRTTATVWKRAQAKGVSVNE